MRVALPTTEEPLAEEPAAGSGAMFDTIAGRYDLLNRLLSLGIDGRWRRRAARALAGPGGAPPARVLDVATGTADLALAVARAYPSARVVGLNPSQGMLAVARRKVAAAGLGERLRLERGDALALPFAAASFDAVTIAFGLRNLSDRPRALREMARVTRPGGRVVVLELGEPREGLLAPLARLHVRRLVPRLGALLSRAPAYRHLAASMAAFPPPEELCRLLEQAGLRVLGLSRLAFGVAHLVVAEVVPKGVAEVAASARTGPRQEVTPCR